MPVLAAQGHRQTAADMYDPAMTKERMISAREARDGFSDMIDAAEQNEVRSVVVRRSKTAAVVVPPGWYRRACEALGETTNV